MATKANSLAYTNWHSALIDNKFIKLSKLKSLIRIKLHRQPKGMIKFATVSYRKFNLKLCLFNRASQEFFCNYL
jgi:hypothetical protein